MTHETYLGDGVYAHIQDDFIVLTTGDHRPHMAGNVIRLETEVRQAFVAWLERSWPEPGEEETMLPPRTSDRE